MYPDGPWCEVDVEELLQKNDVWWAAQGDFAKLSLDRFKRTKLIDRKLSTLIYIRYFGFFVFFSIVSITVV